MAPRDKVEFVILRLTFVPYIDPLYPRISLSRRKHSPSSSLTQVRDWFDRTMSHERAQLPPNMSVRYSEWRIMSGNANLFTVNSHRFDRAVIVMGEDSSYWIFYQNIPMHRRIEGSGQLPVTYCGCCLYRQYVKIIEVVKGNLTRPNTC